jgi:hypothetical protein
LAVGNPGGTGFDAFAAWDSPQSLVTRKADFRGGRQRTFGFAQLFGQRVPFVFQAHKGSRIIVQIVGRIIQLIANKNDAWIKIRAEVGTQGHKAAIVIRSANFMVLEVDPIIRTSS